MNKKQILKIVDKCFHKYASDFRNEAKKEAEKMIDEQLALCNVVGRSEQLLFSPDDIEKIVNEKSIFNGKEFRRIFEK